MFAKPTPLLFAHRGGAREVEESTVRGLRFAVEQARAEVLEIDVHVLTDGEIVVWHGPDLHNVRIDAKGDRDDISRWAWRDLAGRAWVAHPDYAGELHDVPQAPDTALITLEQALQAFPNSDFNIEMKRSFRRREDVARLVGLLDRERNGRRFLVVSQSGARTAEFRALVADREEPPHASGLSTREAIGARLPGRRPGAGALRDRALQTSHARSLSPSRVVERVHEAGGAVHVFLTAFTFLAPAIDAAPGSPTQEKLFPILARGVDGVMTDRPRRVRELLDAWRQQQGP